MINGAHAGAVAEMSDDELGVYAIWRQAGERRNNVFIRQPVETVAPDPARCELTRQSELLSNRRLATVERCIKTSDLRYFRGDGGHRLDCGDIVRLVQRRKRDQRGKVRNNVVID